jgi:hypothetical protein
MSGIQDVEEAVILPMTTTFPPPTHLRGNRQAIASALNIYRRALEGFERPILEQAFQKAAAENEYMMWPKCSAILKAAEEFHRAAHPPPRNPDAWVEKATALSDQYVRRFLKTSTHAVRARQGGYEAELKAYVREASWVQAQYILGRDGVGYASAVLFNGDLRRDRDHEEEFFSRARKQAESGHIRVHIAPELMKRWQGEAQGRPMGRSA